MPLVTYDEKPWVAAMRNAVAVTQMPPWFADPRYGKFSNDPSLEQRADCDNREVGGCACAGRDPERRAGAAALGAGLEYSAARSSVHDADAGAAPGAGRRGVHLRDRADAFHGRALGADVGDASVTVREHVHHAVVYIRPPKSTWLRDAPVGKPFTASDMTDPKSRAEAQATTSDMLLVYAPGSEPDRWPEGMAKYIPAGSDLVFQMHYTTNGTAATDQTSDGNGLCEAAAGAARADAATHQSLASSFRRETDDYRVQSRNVAEGCDAAQFFPAYASAGQTLRVQHRACGWNRSKRCCG